jgi:hypothetical protein
MAPEQGFEPQLMVLETIVLPITPFRHCSIIILSIEIEVK